MVGRTPRDHAPRHAMIPQAFHGEDPQEVCDLQRKWSIAPELANRLWRMAQNIPFGLTIHSGMRTEAEQDALRATGRPTAPNDLSTHLSCPATGADVRFTLGAANLEKTSQVQFGYFAVLSGLRWGGGGAIDPATGIPLDWQHLDLGPRLLTP